MNDQDKEFQRRLLATFKIEAEEHIKTLSDGLIKLEKAAPADKQTEILETIYREVHSFKGAARAVNMTEIESICQSLESVLASLKRGDLSPWPEMFDTLYLAIDTIEKLHSSREGVEISELIEQLTQLKSGEGKKPVKAAGPQPPKDKKLRDAESEKPVASETIRISLSKLSELFRQAEEMLSVKQTIGQRVSDIRDVLATFRQWEKEYRKTYQDIRQLQNPKLTEFLDLNHTYIKSVQHRLTSLAGSIEQSHRSVGGMIDNLVEDMKKTLMFPFSSLLELLPRMVRDLSRDKGKKVQFVLEGGEVEIDRRILETMMDPLIHLIRNCIDHGIEKPEERERFRKTEEGTVTVAISRVGGDKVEILISDDGGGIDLDSVKKAAVKIGVISENDVEKLNEQESLSLLFESGVSTSSIITDVSGRGLGLSIVQEKVGNSGGFISVETHPHKGTSFRILLPVTLATFRGILVRTSDQLFMAPTANVDRMIRVKRNDIKTVENRETIPIDEGTISVVRLDDVLEIPRKEMKDEALEFIVMVLEAEEKRIAFIVDEVIIEQEGLVKKLGKQLIRIRNIAGATVLGSGKVVPILNVPDLIKSAMKVAVAPAGTALLAEEVEEKRKSIQVVEDSITARMLLKNILEAAGYHVETAPDGMDAFSSLKEGDFDLVVSDVDMPRMNGFELTSKIRSDKKLAEIPVVLVTALESREDRERGIDVGADAYIVKSSFDQSNLLEVIGRFI